MQLAAVIYPGFTALDMVGPFEVLAFVPGVETVLVAERPGPARSSVRHTAWSSTPRQASTTYRDPMSYSSPVAPDRAAK